MKYEEVKDFLGKKVICNMHGWVKIGLLRRVSVSKKYLEIKGEYSVLSWHEIDKITDIEEIPKEKRFWERNKVV